MDITSLVRSQQAAISGHEQMQNLSVKEAVSADEVEGDSEEVYPGAGLIYSLAQICCCAPCGPC